MICMDCDAEITDQNEHWADCAEAPDYVRYQAKAERRYRAGGPFAEPHMPPCIGRRCRNLIDRGEPDPPCRRPCA